MDAQNASTRRLENPHRTRVSHTAHAHYFFGRKKNIKDNDVSRTRLAMRPGIGNSLTGRLREDLSEGLRNYVRANTGRDGFWLHRYLLAHGITNQVVDSRALK